ncbi:MAG: hypothetical protein GX571_03290 [Lentisphaerae bacterium]|nr:hypothetical protein [Lentisphaerota bacterium]
MWTSLVLSALAHVVVPDCGRHYVNAAKALDIRAPLFHMTAPNAGLPFMAVADEGGGFLAAFGVVSPTGEVEIRRILPRISRRKAMVGGDHFLSHEILWRRAGEVREIRLDLYTQTRAPTWHHALREYTRAIREAEGIVLPVHPDALLPVWCTWTVFCSSEMTDCRVLANARIARDLGIGTVILDDGWFGTGLDDDEGELTLGDYHPAPHKFPDLRRHVAELQALGLKVLLWYAPLCAAPASQAYRAMRRFLIHDASGEFMSVNGLAQLCPSCPEVRQYVADESARLMRETGADGFKVDLFNCLPPGPCVSTAHDHDTSDSVEALEAVMAVQWEAMRGIRPDALCELKQDYGNVRLARYGTMVRAGDTAYDVDTNCRRCFHTGACVPCVHNDYFVTSDLASPQAVALAMVRMLAAGVTTFGNDLETMPAAHRLVVGQWLGFYRAHIDMFAAPREPQANDMSCWQGGDAGIAWVAPLWQCREVRLPAAGRTGPRADGQGRVQPRLAQGGLQGSRRGRAARQGHARAQGARRPDPSVLALPLAAHPARRGRQDGRPRGHQGGRRGRDRLRRPAAEHPHDPRPPAHRQGVPPPLQGVRIPFEGHGRMARGQLHGRLGQGLPGAPRRRAGRGGNREVVGRGDRLALMGRRSKGEQI